MTAPVQRNEPRDASRAWLLTVPKTADLLAISQRAVWSLLASRKLTPVRLGRRTTRIDSRDVERLIDTARDAGGL